MSLDHGLHRESPLARSSSSSPLNTNASSPSASLSRLNEAAQASSSTLPNRPRHHARNFSTESRFVSPPNGDASPSSAHPSKSSDNNNINNYNSPSIVIDPSSPPTRHASPPPAISASLPVRSKKSGSPPLSSSVDQATAKSSSSLPRHSQSPPRSNGSPSKRISSLEEIREKEQLELLKEQQANRRPKMMRLTPAYSSTPLRLQSTVTKNGTGKGASVMMKSSSQGSESNVIEFPHQTGSTEDEVAPGVGLQIDLGCIPTPSLQDLNGPISTSRIETMVRDRNGNPIKPSLKSPRSSVSHFLPGRTVRSDSTPILPSNLHSKSVPTTPTVAKAVHFDSKLEHVKVFKFKQRPTAVSRDGSPEQTETETEEEKDQFPYIWRKNQIGGTSRSNSPPTNAFLDPTMQSNYYRNLPATPQPEVEEQLVLRLPNFPSSTRLSVDREIFLERIFLAEDLRSVKGTVQVRNMSFEKWVAIRYTLDHWATIGEVSAEYSETIKGGQADRFAFSIKLNELLNWPRGSAAHETKSMFMCLRYTVNQAEFWDNNEGLNYQLDFRKRQIPTTPLSTPTAATTAATSTTTTLPSSSAAAASAVMPLMAQPRATVAPSSTQNNAVRSKVFELARKGGVGGRGVFAMEDLKRELDKLRSDEEEEEQALTPTRTFASELAKKKASPPGSPNGRSSSPSIWTARYDFGQSLRNPRSGSRNTGLGRAAALDYFSAKPMSRNGSNSLTSSTDGTKTDTSPNTAAKLIPIGKFEEMSLNVKDSPDFSHKFGMISPGLGGSAVEHKPLISASATPSAEVSPLPTPSQHPAHNQSPGTPNSHGSDRFHSYPPSRQSNASTPTLSSNGGIISPGFFTPSTSLASMMMDEDDNDPSANLLSKFDVAEKINETSATMEDYSPNASPISDYGSPSPFSPTDSISSTESETTVSNLATPEDRLSKIKTNLQSGHSRRNNNVSIASSLSTTSLDAAPRTSLTSSLSPSSASTDGQNGEKLRPASMSDYQELVNKYCWNSDLVPSGGSTIPDMPMNGGLNGSTTLIVDGHSHMKLSPKVKSPALDSGASTPTLRGQ